VSVPATRFTELVGCRLPIQLAGMARTSVPELVWGAADRAVVARIHDGGALAGDAA